MGKCRKTLLFKISDILEFKINLNHEEDSASITVHISTKKLKSDEDEFKVNVTCKDTQPEFSKELTCGHDWSQWELMRIRSFSTCDNVSQHIFNLDITVPAIEHTKYAEFYNDANLIDFHLSAPDGTVSVHKLIMAAHSDVFKTMLNGEWKETEKGCVELKGFTRQTLQHLKDYMYLGTLPDYGLQELLLLALRYLIHGLKEKCIQKLTKTVTSENFYTLIDFAVENRVPELTFGLIEETSTDIFNEACQKMMVLPP